MDRGRKGTEGKTKVTPSRQWDGVIQLLLEAGGPRLRRQVSAGVQPPVAH